MLRNLIKISSYFKINIIYYSVIICLAYSADEKSDGDTSTLVFDKQFLLTAIKDIAYYLRSFKFNEWDRRFYKHRPTNESLFYFNKMFPSPALRSLHWEVRENCERGFHYCAEYLQSVIESAPILREDDPVYLINKNPNVDDIILNHANSECEKSYKISDNNGSPYENKVESFKWKTTASYYMCWYTMREIPLLIQFNEPCDNFARCIDPVYGGSNKDPRANDSIEYSCALYSFCPDLCCPLKHVKSLAECLDSKKNPCYLEHLERDDLRKCGFERALNTDFERIKQNHWNLSCICEREGFYWNSRFGMCVDIDECFTKTHNCDLATEDCFNLPGSFECICKMGYSYNEALSLCLPNNIFTEMKNAIREESQGVELFNKVKNAFKKIKNRNMNNSK